MSNVIPFDREAEMSDDELVADILNLIEENKRLLAAREQPQPTPQQEGNNLGAGILFFLVAFMITSIFFKIVIGV